MANSSKPPRYVAVAKKRDKRGPAKTKRWYRGAVIATTFAAFSGVVGYGVYALYEASRQQTLNNYTSLNKDVVGDLLSENIEPIVTPQTIAGEPGYSVSMGPIRIESAYSALFDKEELVSMAKWIYNNVNWGANGLSLQTITFTTGIDANTNSITLGSHTSDRAGSSIYLSPDAFEQASDLTGKTVLLFSENVGVIGLDPEYVSFVEGLNLTSSLISQKSKQLDDTLNLTFNGATVSGLETRGSYKTLTAEDVKGVLNLVVGDIFTDNYLTLVHPELQGALATTQISDGIFTDSQRWLAALSRQKIDDYVASGLDRVKYVLAQRLFDASTNGANSLANAFWRIFLRRSIDDSASATDLNALLSQVLLLPDLKIDNTQTYRMRPFSEWGQAWQNYLDYLSADGSITNAGLDLRDMVFSLFSFYYQMASDLLANEPGISAAIKRLLNNRDLLFLKYWDTTPSTYNEGGKIRFLLKGALDKAPSFLLSPGDGWLLESNEKWRLSATTYDERTLQLGTDQPVFNELITDKSKINLKTGDVKTSSIADFLRSSLIDRMRFTLSHEYGHHETLWQAWGYYDNTLQLYDEKSSARQASPVNRDILNKFFTAASASPGLKNVAEVLKRSNDKFSDTWSPTIYKNDYIHYFPDVNGYTSDQITLYRFEYDSATGTVNNREQAFIPKQFVLPGADSAANRQAPGFVYVLDPTNLGASNPFRASPRASGVRIHLMSLLDSYQQTKWFTEGKTQNSAWAKDNRVSLYTFRAGTTFASPTVEYASRISSDGQGNTLAYDFESWLQAGPFAPELIREINKVVGAMYNELLAQHPNLYENKGTQHRLSDYERGKIVLDYVMKKTQTELGDKQNASTQDLNTPGVYFAPQTLEYKTYRPLDQVDDYWKEHNNNELVSEGTIQLGSSVSSFVDYTSSYAEFMTRYLNQLAYRPNYNKYLQIDNPENYDIDTLLLESDDWYNDLNMFHSYGAYFYNYDLNDKTNTRMTADGARMVIWTQELLGMHSDLDLAGQMPVTSDGKIDFDAIDNAVTSANIVEKVFRKYKTSEYSIWGWFTPEQAAKYNYVVLKDTTSGKVSYIPIYTKNTSNYFYFEDLTNQHKRKFNKNFVQWASEWTIGGDFSNTVLAPGKHEVYFSTTKDESNLESPIAINFQDKKTTVRRTNNDYVPVLAQVILTLDPLERKIILEVKK